MWVAIVVLALLVAVVMVAVFARRNEGPQNYLGDVTARWRRR